MDHRRSLVVALAIALALVAGSTPHLVGDGGEYLTQALNFASFRGPAFDPESIPSLETQVHAADPSVAGWSIVPYTVASRDGRRDVVHFWFYALLATPGIWITRAVGVNPLVAFTLLNLTLLGLALRVALPRLGPTSCLLLFGGPIVWWLDKAHTEGFTFALLVISLVLVRERPWWSMVAAGAAATQNPPIAALAGLVFVSQATLNRPVLRDWRFWAGAATALVLALLHPAYFLVRHATPSLLLGANRLGLPAFVSLSAPVLDPDIGLVANFPAFALAVIVALAIMLRAAPRELLSSDVHVAWIAGLVFLFSAAQTINVHHGGTPSISRYALWLAPLAVPLLRRAEAVRHPRRMMCAVAAASAVVCMFAFHPRIDQYSREPTWAATFLWTHHPSWNNPLPEVFSETLRGVEESWAPVATPGCEKILITGRNSWTGVWPMPCYPALVPSRCQETNTLCYANRAGREYRFAVAPGPQVRYGLRREWVWPRWSEQHIQQLFNEWRWWELEVTAPGRTVVEASAQVDRVWTWAGKDRFLIVIARPGTGASVTLRLARPVAGRLVDAATGTTLEMVSSDASPDGRWALALPPGFEVLLLALADR